MDPPLRKKQETVEIRTLPQHIIFSHILPFLPFKTLTRFKSVAKSWKKLISEDPLFALDQSRHVSPISCGTVFAGCHGGNLVFFPTFGSPIGIPNPSLDFIPGGKCQRIFASANGLLCLQCYGDSRFFYICNAVTEEGHTVADDSTDGSRDSIGLAFDPRISTECYKLVHPLRHHRLVLNCPAVDYGFEVFSSDTNKWVESSQEIHGIGELWHHRKAICVDGIVYWDCETYLLSFDPWKDVAGYVTLPEHLGRRPRHEIGAYNGRITYTMIDGRDFEVWIFSGDDEKAWEMKHSVKVDEMIKANQDVFLRFRQARRTTRSSEVLLLDSSARPFPFEGGEKLHFMFNIGNKSRMQNKENVVLSYDLKTGKVKELCVFNPKIRYKAMDEIVFSYHSSMVRVPKLGS